MFAKLDGRMPMHAKSTSSRHDVNSNEHPSAPPSTPHEETTQWSDAGERRDTRPQRARRDSSPAHFINKMRAAPHDVDHGVEPHVSLGAPADHTTHYFFYGSLSDIDTLARALSVEKAPPSRPAEVVGYRVQGHGAHKSLVDGGTGEVVKGVAVIIDDAEGEQRLASFCEEGAFEVVTCQIFFKDGGIPQEVMGQTFVATDGE